MAGKVQTGVIKEIRNHDGDFRIVLKGKMNYFLIVTREDRIKLNVGDTIIYQPFNKEKGWFVSLRVKAKAKAS